MRSDRRCCSSVALCVVATGWLVTGCALTLPEYIKVREVDKVFMLRRQAPPRPDLAEAHVLDPTTSSALPPTSDPETERLQDVVYQSAQDCAGRMNGHIEAAHRFSIIRTVVTAIGGVTSGAGGVLSAFVSSDDQQKGAAWVAAAGGGIALAGTFIVGLSGDPAERLASHSRALRSWDRARAEALRAVGKAGRAQQQELQEIDDLLQDCIKDQAPPDTRSLSGPDVPAK
jgi:hypothetical protein